MSTSNLLNRPNPLPTPSTAHEISDTEIITLSHFFARSAPTLAHRQRGLPMPRNLKRSRIIPDALVSCITSTYEQNLALSIALGPSIRICIAQKGQTPQLSVKVHMENMWRHLQDISALQKLLSCNKVLSGTICIEHKFLKSVETLGLHKKPTYESLAQLKQALNRDIHMFCYWRTRHTVKKYLNGIHTIHNYIISLNTPEHIGHIRLAVSSLNDIYYIIMRDKGPYNRASIPDLAWNSLVDSFDRLHRWYTKNMPEKIDGQITRIMSEWGKLPKVKKDRILKKFDLSKALKEVGKLSSRIQDLINFACLRGPQSQIEKQLEVVLVDPIAIKLPEPSLDEIKDTVQRAFLATEYATKYFTACHALGKATETALQASLTKQLDLVQSTLTPPLPASSLCVHAEYSLLVHLDHESRTKHLRGTYTPPLRYISTSRASCVSCLNIYDDYSMTMGRKLHLHYSSERTLIPWSAETHHFKDGVGAALREGLYLNLLKMYSAHLKSSFHNVVETDGVDRSDQREAGEGMIE